MSNMKSSDRINNAVKEIVTVVENESREIATDAVLKKLSDVEQAIREEGKALKDGFKEIAEYKDTASNPILNKLDTIEWAVLQGEKKRRVEFAIERIEEEMKDGRFLGGLPSKRYAGRDIRTIREILYAFRANSGFIVTRQHVGSIIGTLDVNRYYEGLQKELHELLGSKPRLTLLEKNEEFKLRAEYPDL